MMLQIQQETSVDIIAFFEQSPSMAISYRLSLVQRKRDDYALLERELTNIWQAVQWCYQYRDWSTLIAFRDMLQHFLSQRGHWDIYLTLNSWACNAAEVLGDVGNATRWTHDQADLLQQQGNYYAAEQLYRKCEKKYTEQELFVPALKSRHMRALAIRAQGRYAEAMNICMSVIAEARQRKLDDWLAHPFYVQALLARDLRQFRYAEQLIQESLARLSAEHDKTMIVQCYHFLGDIALRKNDLVHAHLFLEQALQKGKQSGSVRRIASTQRLLGNLARQNQQYEEALTWYDNALASLERIGDFPERARTLLERGKLKAQQHDMMGALLDLRSALSLYRTVGHKQGIPFASLQLSRVLFCQWQWGEAFVVIVSMLAISVPLLYQYLLLFFFRHRIKSM